jgi:hypothetical protein
MTIKWEKDCEFGAAPGDCQTDLATLPAASELLRDHNMIRAS